MALTQTDTPFQVTGVAAVAEPTVRDILLRQVGGETQIYALTDAAGDGIARLSINGAGQISQDENQFETGESPVVEFTFFNRTDPSGLAFATIEGVDYVVATAKYEPFIGGDGTGPTLFQIGPGGALISNGTIDRMTGDRSPDTIVLDSSTYLFEAGQDGSLVVLDISSLDTLQFISASKYDLDDRNLFDVHTAGLVADSSAPDQAPDEKAFFYLNNANEIEYLSFAFASSAFGGALATTKTSFSKRPKDLELAYVDNKSFLITSSEAAGLRVFDVADDGFFLPVITETDTLTNDTGTEDFASDHIVTFSLGDRGFVASAGNELTIYELSKSGILFEQDSLAWPHSEVFDIEAVQKGNGFRIVVAGDTGVVNFDFTPGPGANQNGSDGDDVLIGDGRDNRLEGRGGNDRLEGRSGEDDLFGGRGADRLFGGKDDDTLSGGSGKDRLEGGRGDDTAKGGASRDVIFGGKGNDTLAGGSGRDDLFGGGGSDQMSGDGGADKIVGKGGGDSIFGGSGEDLLRGGSGADRIFGGTGKDRIEGGTGNDFLSGAGGNDRIEGGGGSDRLLGGDRKDKLIDGGGRDSLNGGGGTDIFVFVKDNRRDTIEDFQNRDKIDVSAWGRSIDFDDLRIQESNNGNLLVKYGKESIFVDGRNRLEPNDLTDDHFIF